MCSWPSASSGVVALLQMYQQQRHRGRSQSRNTGGLAQGLRTHIAEPLPDFVRQAADLRIVEVPRQLQRLMAQLPIDLLGLALQVSRVLRLDLDLQFHLLAQTLVLAP